MSCAAERNENGPLQEEQFRSFQRKIAGAIRLVVGSKKENDS